MPAELYKALADATEQQTETDQQHRQQEAASHTIEIELSAPGDVTINPTMDLALSGTGTAFDQSYRIYQIVHTFDANNGYRMTVTAHNWPDGAGSGGGGNFPSVPGFQ